MTDAYQALSLRAAQSIADHLKEKPDSCFGFPTGRTPLGCYEILAQWSRDNKLDWSQARCFALDDYLDIENEQQSFTVYLEDNLYKHTNLPDKNKFNPRFIDNYDAVIAHAGGLDFTVIGIGSNGHIAFNEPGTPAQSWTHSIWLTESTRLANAPFFNNLNQVPRKAVTMGIATILSSRVLMLIANGEKKKEILTQALNGPCSSHIPASFLQIHPNLDVLTDFDFVHVR